MKPTYAETVEAGLKDHASDAELAEFQEWQTAGMARFNACNQIFRVMCSDENQIWNNGTKLEKGVMKVDQKELRNLFQVGGYARKWFVFNRPYMFGREQPNDPQEYSKERVLNPLTRKHETRLVPKTEADGGAVQARQNGQFMLAINLSPAVKAKMAQKIIADRYIKKAEVEKEIIQNSIRVKGEGGTFTLGLPISAVLEVVDELQAQDIRTGGRLIPLLNPPQLNVALAAARREGADAGTSAAVAATGTDADDSGADAAGAAQSRSWAQVAALH